MYRIVVRPGRTLWEELEQKNIVIDRPCGGKGTCGRCSVLLTDGRQVPACQYRAPGIVEIEAFPELVYRAGTEAGEGAQNMTAQRRKFDAVADVTGQYHVCAKTPVVVADIGTTTVVLTVFAGEHNMTRTFVNPQRQYGADVMSRIQAANEGMAGRLQELIRDALVRAAEDALQELFKEEYAQLPEQMSQEGQTCTLIVSANTTMQHLLEGLSCEHLGKAPFVPVDITRHMWDWKTGGAVISEFRAVSLPGISAFVGADIVSGLSVIDIGNCSRPQLVVDLGTNGEMALGCRERLLVTSTAAGPAFEGSALAVRIHGAGMLRLLHELLEQGIMDEYGTLCDEYFDTGYPVNIGAYHAEDVSQDKEEVILLTQEEIRQLQMAKAAVYAGVETLLEVSGIAAEQVENVYLAGGFGYYLNPADAVAAGLLPAYLRGKIRACGNTSYEGAVAYAASPQIYGARCEEICARAEVVSLPECKGFEERYINAMNFDYAGSNT